VVAGISSAGVSTAGLSFKFEAGSIRVTATGPAEDIAELKTAVAEGRVTVSLGGASVPAASVQDTDNKSKSVGIAVGIAVGVACLATIVVGALVVAHRRRNLSEPISTQVFFPWDAEFWNLCNLFPCFLPSRLRALMITKNI
jgi:hypothetical protein